MLAFGSVDIGVGTVIGSNIWNIAGILGISAIAAGIIRTDSSGINRDGLMTLATGIILIFFMLFGDINWIASVIMIALYIFYLWRLIKSQKEYKEGKIKDELTYEPPKKSQLIKERLVL